MEQKSVAESWSRTLRPLLRHCCTQTLTLWFRLERVKHIRSDCLLRRQKAALTSNIEAPRDTAEEFPLAGVCGKPYIKCGGQPVCFPPACRWESSSTSLALCCGDEMMWAQSKLCLCGRKASKQASLSPWPPVLLSSCSSSQNLLENLLADWTRAVPSFGYLISEVDPIAPLSSCPSDLTVS